MNDVSPPFSTYFIIFTLICVRALCLCIVGAQPCMWWHYIQVDITWMKGVIGQTHVFICFWCFFRWAGDRMSWAHVFRRAGVTQTYRKKIGMVLLVPKGDNMCVFLLWQKTRLADDMRIVIFKIAFTTLMSCEHSIKNSWSFFLVVHKLDESFAVPGPILHEQKTNGLNDPSKVLEVLW
jgi:hypothetical protein